MTLTEGVENFQAIVVSLAAIAGSVIAGMSLWTWKQQIRWQQGRGLAVNTLQAFFAFKRIALDVRKQNSPALDESKSEEELIASAEGSWDRANTYCENLEQALITLEKQIAEAMVVWEDDFKDFMSEIAEVEHIARSTVLTGAASIDPRRPRSSRVQSSSLHEAFKSDVYGINSERIGLGERLSKAQMRLQTILYAKRLA